MDENAYRNAVAEDSDVVRRLKRRIAELEARLASKWISVEERLPEAVISGLEGPPIISNDVLCYWPVENGIIEVCNYDHEDKIWSLIHKGFAEPDCDPTHWQPLPVAPSEHPAAETGEAGTNG